MKSCERNASEFPWAVFTNTDQDYQVTFQGPEFPPQARALIDQLASDAEDCVTADLRFLAGVAPVPGIAGRFLAFRIYHLGTYRMRSNTLGLVALLVPGREHRPELLGDLLACLPEPKPGFSPYNPSQRVQAAGLGIVDRMNAWDLSEGVHGPTGVLLFSDPSALCSNFRRRSTVAAAETKPRARRALLVWFLMLGALAGSTAVAVKAIIDARRMIAPPIPVETMDKKELGELLERCGCFDQDSKWATAPPDRLAEIAVAKAKVAQGQMNELREIVREVKKPDAQFDILRGWLRRQKIMKWLENLTDSSRRTISTAELHDAVERLKTYAEILADCQLNCKYDPKDRDFSEKFKTVREKLDRAGR